MVERRIIRRPAQSEDRYTPSRPSEEEDYTDEDEAPRRRPAARRPEPDEEEPRRRVRSRDDADDEPPARRRSRDEDDDEDEPRRGRSAPPPQVRSGWKSFKRQKESLPQGGDIPNTFVWPEDDESIIKILEDEPFATYKQHWVDEVKGKKSWICLETDDCPLDPLGGQITLKTLFNIVDFTDPERPRHRHLLLSITQANQLEELAVSDKTGPLSRPDMYFALKVKKGDGKKKKSVWTINAVKERDLKEDWNIDPLTDEEIADWEKKCSDASIVPMHDRKTLRAVAREAMGDDD